MSRHSAPSDQKGRSGNMSSVPQTSVKSPRRLSPSKQIRVPQSASKVYRSSNDEIRTVTTLQSIVPLPTPAFIPMNNTRPHLDMAVTPPHSQPTTPTINESIPE